MTQADAPQAIPIAILTPDGLREADYTAASLAEAAPKEPPGIYTVGRTFRRVYTLLFDDHLARLAESAQLEGIPLELDREALRHALRALIDQAGYAESRFRITVPRHAPDTQIISLEPFHGVPPEVIENGVRVITLKLARPRPRAKSTDWMAARRAAMENQPDGVYEGILVSDDGALLEGTSSNFYAVVDGALRTAGEGVLPGMAQKVVMHVVSDILPLDLRPVRADQLWVLEEAFLTSASRGIIPIVMIDAQIIGNGRPGPITLKLREAYERWAEAHLEPLR